MFYAQRCGCFSDPGKMEMMAEWCRDFPAIEWIMFHIASVEPKTLEARVGRLARLHKIASVWVSTPSGDTVYGSGKPEVLLVLGRSGCEEIAGANAAIATEGIAPELITEATIESHLLYQVNQNFVIKTGGSHLTDFLIWQSVYSELFLPTLIETGSGA